jgi:hypothetical protein
MLNHVAPSNKNIICLDDSNIQEISWHVSSNEDHTLFGKGHSYACASMGVSLQSHNEILGEKLLE